MITIYPATTDDFSGNGLFALDNHCLSATIAEKLNGEYTLRLELMINERTVTLANEMVIKTPAPVRYTPAVQIQQTQGETQRIYKVQTSTGQRLNLRTKPSLSSGRVIKAYPNGTEMAVSDQNGDWSTVTAPDGNNGYMWSDSLVFVRDDTPTSSAVVIGEEGKTREQLFRVSSVVATLDAIEVEAQHISYDLRRNYIKKANTKGMAGADALTAVLNAAVNPHEFVAMSDITEQIETDIERKSPIAALLSSDGLIEQVGGEILRDNYTIYWMQSIGRDRGVTIAYRKNMAGMSVELDTNDLVTRIIPVGYNKKNEPIFGDPVDSQYIADYAQPYIVEYEYKDIKTGAEGFKTDAAVKAEVERLARLEFDGEIDKPAMTVSVDYVDLRQTDAALAVAAFNGIFMGDLVRIRHEDYRYDFDIRVVGYEWDVLAGDYSSIELGSKPATLANIQISPSQIGDSTLSSRKIAVGAVGGVELGADSIDGEHITNNAVSTEHLGDYVVTVNKLAADSVTAEKIHAEAVTAEKIAADAVIADKLAAGSVEADKVAAGAIEADAIKAGAVTAEKIAADAIITTKIKAGAITTDKLAAGAVTAAKIAAKTITAESGIIDDGAIGKAQIADGSITSAKIVELTADLIKTGTLSADRLLIAGDDGLVYKINATSSGLSMSQLTDDQYKNYINGTVIVAKSITAAQIAAETITGNEILAGSITAKEIDVSDLFANQATIDALNTVDIRGNGYLQLLVDNLHTLKVFDGQLAQAECVDGQGVRVFSTFAPVQSGSGDPAPDNVRAISGHTCAKLVRCGKNILAPVRNWSETRTHNGITFTKNADGSIRVTGTATAQAYAQLCVKAFRFISGVPYIFTGACKGTYIQIGYFTDDTNYVIRAQSDYGEAQMVKDIDGLCRIYLIVNSGTTVNGTVYPQCEIADIATEYESYQGDDYEVDFGQTVYGGSLDWNTGELVVDRKGVVFDGAEIWNRSTTSTDDYFCGFTVMEHIPYSDEVMCSHLPYFLYAGGRANGAYMTAFNKRLFLSIAVKNLNTNDVEGFKAYLAAQYAAGTPVQVSFELAEPETLQLEPTQIAAADGLNTVYTDADDGRIEFGHDSLIPYLQSQIDLIPGKISLAVSTGVAAGVKAGSSIEITEEKVQISSKTTSISIPADDTTDAAEIVSIDEEGLRTTELTAEDIHSDSIVGTAAGGTYTPANAGELRALLDDLAGCCMTGDININAATVAGGSFTIRGLHGHGVLTVTGGTVNDLKVQNCSVMVRFNNTVFESSGTAVTAYNSLLYLSGATLTAAEGVYAYYGARVIMNNCKGDCETVLRATSGSVVTVAGTTCPTGALGLVTAAEVYSTVEFVEPAQAPTVSEVTTVSIAANNTRTWGGSWLSTSTFGTALYQGATGGGTLRRGCMWFPLTAISGKEIISATLTLKRVSGIGGGGSVSIGIYGTTATGASGEPAIGTKYAELTLANGASGSVDVTAAVQALANGTIKGLMIYDDRTGTFGGKTYTYGYCKIYGTGSGVPTLNVTYK